MDKRITVADTPYIKEWDFDANASLDPNKLSAGSAKRANWVCENCHGHYETQICTKTQGHKCPYCSGKKVLPGFNDLVTMRPDVARYWDKDKNEKLPNEVTIGTHEIANWKCDSCGYCWNDSVNHQVHKKGCPACKAGKSDRCGIRIVTEDNCLSSTNPDSLLDWDYSKNTIKPEEVTSGSGKVTYWRCHECHTSYQKKISEQIKYGCGYCSGRYPIKGVNDLATLYPNLAKEWNFKKNGDLRPEAISTKNTRKVWWRCSVCGREWQAYVENRTRDKNGCPSCQARTHTSFPEQALFYYISKNYSEAMNSYRDIFDTQMELDIFIPSLSIAIEYDGKAWHRSKSDVERDKKKYEICKKNNITLIRIAEDDKDVDYCDEFIKSDYKAFQYGALDRAIMNLFDRLGKKTDINSHRDEKAILESYLGRLKKESILEKYPSKCEYWDYNKNGSLEPSMFKPASGVSVSWICPKCGISYDRRIGEQIRGLGFCKKCTSKETAKRLHETKLKANGSLKEKYPLVAEQWDYAKNGDLSPEKVTAHSSQRVWWKCNNSRCNHSWITAISNRTGGDMTGCPKCHNGGISEK